ncbi:MAG: hypothetical protein ABIC19_04260 [Patescibacteria group bacterium]|nr:hypothetical protein [Patescibacteria group bacterium]
MNESFFSGNWLVVALLAPMLWALVSVIDVYFVGGKIYKDEIDGAMISGLFQLVPAGFLFFLIRGELSLFWHETLNQGPLLEVVLGSEKFQAVILAFVGGFVLNLAFFFYFKALFSRNDASLVQILWNLCVVVVPLLSFLVSGEVLPAYKYAGMGIVLAGATLLSLDKTLRETVSARFLWMMAGAILFWSVAMVIQDNAYGMLENHGYRDWGFWIGLFFFTLGGFYSGLLFLIFSMRSPLRLIRKFFPIFFAVESLAFLGIFFSQRAIDISPSVSFVATIETFVPLFVLLFSSLVVVGCRLIGKRKELGEIYRGQLKDIPIKILAGFVMLAGVFVIYF